MRNPWTAKNPFMSLWLSAAHTMTNAARGQAQAELTRQMSSMQSQAVRQWVDLWSGQAAAPSKKRKRR